MRQRFTASAQRRLPVAEWLAGVQENEPPRSEIKKRLAEFAAEPGDDPAAAQLFSDAMQSLAQRNPDVCFTIAQCGARVARDAGMASAMLPACIEAMLAVTEGKARDWAQLDDAFADLPAILSFARQDDALKTLVYEAALRMARPIMLIEPDIYNELMDDFSQALHRKIRSEVRAEETRAEQAREAGDALLEGLALQRSKEEAAILETLNM